MIVLAAFMQSALVFGVIRSFGVFFVEFMAYFQEPASATSWITSVTVAVLMFTSEYPPLCPQGEMVQSSLSLNQPYRFLLLPTGPLASALSTQYGERPVAIVGGFLLGLGLVLASFATSLVQLYMFIGLLTGKLRNVWPPLGGLGWIPPSFEVAKVQPHYNYDSNTN